MKIPADSCRWVRTERTNVFDSEKKNNCRWVRRVFRRMVLVDFTPIFENSFAVFAGFCKIHFGFDSFLQFRAQFNWVFARWQIIFQNGSFQPYSVVLFELINWCVSRMYSYDNMISWNLKNLSWSFHYDASISCTNSNKYEFHIITKIIHKLLISPANHRISLPILSRSTTTTIEN